jgi:hypothetical protein
MHVAEFSLSPYPVFLQVIGKVGDHDLGLGGDTILRRSTLLAGLTRATGSGLLVLSSLFSCKRFVRRLRQRNNLAGYICRSAVSGGGVGEFDLFGTLSTVGLLARAISKSSTEA